MKTKWPANKIYEDVTEYLDKHSSTPEQTFELYISKKETKTSRSLMMNNYLWGVVYPPLQEAINKKANEIWDDRTADIEDIHEMCKHLFNYKLVGKIKVAKSTATLTNKEFIDYFQKIQRFASEYYNTYIPDPNEDDFHWLDINNWQDK